MQQQKVIHKETNKELIVKDVKFLSLTKGFEVTLEESLSDLSNREPSQFTMKAMNLDKFYEFFEVDEK